MAEKTKQGKLFLIICSVFVESGSSSFNVGDYVVIWRYTGL